MKARPLVREVEAAQRLSDRIVPLLPHKRAAVATICARFGSATAEIDEALREYARFLVVAAHLVHGGAVVPSPFVDELWHLHLEDGDYERFCMEQLGMRLNHEVRADSDGFDYPAAYDATVVEYSKLFGDPRRATYWPRSCDGDCKGTGTNG
jgi:hypothetical protein